VRRWISVLDWLPHYRRADLPGDVVAGITGAAVLVPQSMAYAQIAHLPPVVGLYASVVPLLVYAVRLLLVNVDENVREVMDASGLSELIGLDHFFATDADAVAHLDARR
jgi:Sulfate permease family